VRLSPSVAFCLPRRLSIRSSVSSSPSTSLAAVLSGSSVSRLFSRASMRILPDFTSVYRAAHSRCWILPLCLVAKRIVRWEYIDLLGERKNRLVTLLITLCILFFFIFNECLFITQRSDLHTLCILFHFSDKSQTRNRIT